MSKKENGSLTIEATIAFVMFLLMFLIFLSFGQYTKMQNAVKHSLNQTLLTMSMANNQRVWQKELTTKTIGVSMGDITEFVKLFSEDAANKLSAATGQPYTDHKPLATEIKQYFTYYLCTDTSWDSIKQMDDSALDAELKKKGVTDLKVSPPETKDKTTGEVKTEDFVKKDKITVNITYKIKVPFAYLGLFSSGGSSIDELTFTDSLTFVLYKPGVA